MGKLIINGQKNGEIATQKSDRGNQHKKVDSTTQGLSVPKTLKDIGLTKNDASKYKKLATIKEKLFEDKIESETKKGNQITTANLLKLAPKNKAESQDDTPSKDNSHFNKTNDNIGWAAWSWNPVTGCKFGCDYCYAHDIAIHYTGHFEPTFHEDRLNAPANTKPNMGIRGGTRVFVCSMGELFGDWVEQEWIDKVMEQVKNNPQWTFLFLTKNPKRLTTIDFPKNAWVGTTVDIQKRVAKAEKYMEQVKATKKFVSCEPLLENVIFEKPELFDWFLIGAKSEGAKKVQPETKWTLDLIVQAYSAGKAIWMKDNLDLIQEEL
jgi:protein gp37